GLGVALPVGEVEEGELQNEQSADEPAKEVLPSAPPAQKHLKVEDRTQHDTQHRRGCRRTPQPAAEARYTVPARNSTPFSHRHPEAPKKCQIGLDGYGQTCELWIEKPCDVYLDERTRRRPLRTGQGDCAEDRSCCISLVTSAGKNFSLRLTA